MDGIEIPSISNLSKSLVSRWLLNILVEAILGTINSGAVNQRNNSAFDQLSTVYTNQVFHNSKLQSKSLFFQ
jgi:hypothetical protein